MAPVPKLVSPSQKICSLPLKSVGPPQKLVSPDQEKADAPQQGILAPTRPCAF